MFQSKTKDPVPVTSSNIIGQESHLEGTIQTTGNLRVEGKVTGGIQTKAKVVLGRTAYISGNITAQNAEIGGEVRGTIEVVELLVLKSTAVVLGDLIAGKLVFEEGACFEGKCKIGKKHQGGASSYEAVPHLDQTLLPNVHNASAIDDRELLQPNHSASPFRPGKSIIP